MKENGRRAQNIKSRPWPESSKEKIATQTPAITANNGRNRRRTRRAETLLKERAETQELSTNNNFLQRAETSKNMGSALPTIFLVASSQTQAQNVKLYDFKSLFSLLWRATPKQQ